MADLEFRLYDQLNDGTQIGSTQSVAAGRSKTGCSRSSWTSAQLRSTAAIDVSKSPSTARR